MSTQNIGAVTSEQIFVASLRTSLAQALLNPPKAAWQGSVAPICMYENASDQLAGGSSGSGVDKLISKEVIFSFSPPTASMELMATGRAMSPLVRESIKVVTNRWTSGYYADRRDFYADMHRIIRDVPQKLVRPAVKLNDKLLAAVLRNGKTTADQLVPTKNFFDTGKPLSPAGATTDTYANLYTSASLTAANIQRVVTTMMGLKGEDRINLQIKPDTLIIPAELYGAAQQAAGTEYPVYSSPSNPFNAQPANTAAMGQNWIATSKMIQQIVVLPELTDGNASIDLTTWYVSECNNPGRGGAPGLVLAEDPALELGYALSPNDYDVATNDRYSWWVQKYAGAAGGLSVFIARCES